MDRDGNVAGVHQLNKLGDSSGQSDQPVRGFAEFSGQEILSPSAVSPVAIHWFTQNRGKPRFLFLPLKGSPISAPIAHSAAEDLPSVGRLSRFFQTTAALSQKMLLLDLAQAERNSGFQFRLPALVDSVQRHSSTRKIPGRALFPAPAGQNICSHADLRDVKAPSGATCKVDMPPRKMLIWQKDCAGRFVRPRFWLPSQHFEIRCRRSPKCRKQSLRNKNSTPRIPAPKPNSGLATLNANDDG